MSFLSGSAAGVGNVVHNTGCCHMLFSSSKKGATFFFASPSTDSFPKYVSG